MGQGCRPSAIGQRSVSDRSAIGGRPVPHSSPRGHPAVTDCNKLPQMIHFFIKITAIADRYLAITQQFPSGWNADSAEFLAIARPNWRLLILY